MPKHVLWLIVSVSSTFVSFLGRSTVKDFGSTLLPLLIRALGQSAAAPDAVGVWLFGSALTIASPHDIDLLYIYRQGVQAAKRAIVFRTAVTTLIMERLGMDVDVILLSASEAEELDFIRLENAVPLWPPPG